MCFISFSFKESFITHQASSSSSNNSNYNQNHNINRSYLIELIESLVLKTRGLGHGHMNEEETKLPLG
ncbi:hypothetical protein CISIN_1g035337mg [Citrus sinensis]|uniref:Uncharacterized protein n=1 Tax=Citrus sinensis TaxID=2711 RepID=A0A067EK54_CITSI|nr:hypothetical protein CISIN_1g035337mg [Citrus sinensis]